MHFTLPRMISMFAIACLLAEGQTTVTTTGGTVNVVPKYSRTATLVNSAIFENGGKVGIGTTAPSATLMVNGSLTATGATIVANAFRFYTGSLDGNKSYVDFRANPSSGNSVISAKSGTLYLNLDHGTGGVSFGNGAAGVVASISAAGNAVFSGTGNSSFAGNLGIGTTTPTSKLTVTGVVQSTSGGFKFPDGSVLTTAAAKGITSVSHDATLAGSGTSTSPLSLASPLTLTSSSASNAAITINNAAPGGAAFRATGGPAPSGFSGGAGGYFSGGDGDTTNGLGGKGLVATGGSARDGGDGIDAYGGNAAQTIGRGGYGIYAVGGLDEGHLSRVEAAYLDGNVIVTGSLAKAGGSFKIDHPLDPANRYLSHSFVESPDMMNVYNGNIVTDGRGTVTVQLPDWFEALNRDFRYQLTVIGQFAQAIVASKIADNQFTIQTDKPNVEVSWQVTGIRQDVWANAHRIPVEEEKPEKTRGYYLHPELYNQPSEKSVEWAERPELMQAMAQRADHR
jgi:hypothetical protein